MFFGMFFGMFLGMFLDMLWHGLRHVSMNISVVFWNMVRLIFQIAVSLLYLLF